MIGVILYTLLEFINYYSVYRWVFGTRFTREKKRYIVIITLTCIVQLVVLYMVDDTWRDIIAAVAGLFGAIILSESKKWETMLLYPIVFFLSGLINILGSYIIADFMGITQKDVANNIELTLLAECTAIFVFSVYGVLRKKKKEQEWSFTVGQYLMLLIGAICFFVVVAFSQAMLQDNTAILYSMKDVAAIACAVVALLFVVLSIWLQLVWKKSILYEAENEKYKLFLTGQEEQIRMLTIEDEKRRKLRHDMNAHIIALDSMVEKGEWESLREYMGQMKNALGENVVEKYTTISAVDAVIDEWHKRAVKQNIEWSWCGKLESQTRVTIFELCVIFSNLLSNAVEALSDSTKSGKIEVKVSHFQGRIVLVVGNTYEKNVDLNGRPKTTKTDDVYHGLGLKNVEEIVHKHNGSVEYSSRDNWFSVELIL